MSERLIVEQFLDLQDKPREEALKTLLTYYEIKHEEVRCNVDCNNILVRMTDKKPYKLLVAHYDVYGNSTGINDNTTAIAMLIEVIRHFKKENKKVDFNVLFTDKEESGMIGSYYFSSNYRKEIEEAIVFDIIGYGESAVYAESSVETNESILKEIGIKRINQFLPSDNISFKNNGVKSTLIVAAHDNDLVLNKDGLYELNSKPRFYESFHNREKDNDIEVINFELIKDLREKIIKLFS